MTKLSTALISHSDLPRAWSNRKPSRSSTGARESTRAVREPPAPLALPRQSLTASVLTSCIDIGRALVDNLHSLPLSKDWDKLVGLPKHKLLAQFSAADDDASGAGCSICRLLLPGPDCRHADVQEN